MDYNTYLGLILPKNVSASDITDIIDSQKGIPGGIAELNDNGKVPSTQLPTYVDEIIEYPTAGDFPVQGETGVIYCDVSTTSIYRWAGTDYVEIPPNYSEATYNASGLMSAEDKFKLDHASKTYRCVCTTAVDTATKVISGMDSTISLDEEVVLSVRFTKGNTVTNNVKLQISGSSSSYPIWLFDSKNGGDNFKWKEQQTINFVFFGTGYRVLSTIPGYADANNAGYMSPEDKTKLDALDDKLTINWINGSTTGSIYKEGAFAGASGYSFDPGAYSISEGYRTYATGQGAHAEGCGREGYTHGPQATAKGAHVEGYGDVKATGDGAHAEGYADSGGGITASGKGAHSEGRGTRAQGNWSHAEGQTTTASGQGAHSEGRGTVAQCKSQHVFGEYNILDTVGSTTTQGAYVEIVGNGISSSDRSNARTLDWNGNEVLAGKLTVGTTCTQDMDVATKKYVDDLISQGGGSGGSSNIVILTGTVNLDTLEIENFNYSFDDIQELIQNEKIPILNIEFCYDDDINKNNAYKDVGYLCVSASNLYDNYIVFQSVTNNWEIELTKNGSEEEIIYNFLNPTPKEIKYIDIYETDIQHYIDTTGNSIYVDVRDPYDQEVCYDVKIRFFTYNTGQAYPSVEMFRLKSLVNLSTSGVQCNAYFINEDYTAEIMINSSGYVTRKILLTTEADNEYILTCSTNENNVPIFHWVQAN